MALRSPATTGPTPRDVNLVKDSRSLVRGCRAPSACRNACAGMQFHSVNSGCSIVMRSRPSVSSCTDKRFVMSVGMFECATPSHNVLASQEQSVQSGRVMPPAPRLHPSQQSSFLRGPIPISHAPQEEHRATVPCQGLCCSRGPGGR